MENKKEIGTKIKKETEVKNEKVQEIKFEDLPKKVQKQLLRRKFFSDLKPVVPREIEEGTIKVVQYIKNQKKAVTRKEIVNATGFVEKKVKRILNRVDGILIKKETSFKMTRYTYIGQNLIK